MDTIVFELSVALFAFNVRLKVIRVVTKFSKRVPQL